MLGSAVTISGSSLRTDKIFLMMFLVVIPISSCVSIFQLINSATPMVLPKSIHTRAITIYGKRLKRCFVLKT